MSSWQVSPASALQGRLRVPADKSISHRALMLLAVSHRGGKIRGLLESEDCLHTLGALRSVGAEIQSEGPGDYRVAGFPAAGFHAPEGGLDLGNSGTGLRLLTGLFAGLGVTATLTGDASLCRRPMDRIVRPLRRMGVSIHDRDGRPPLRLGWRGRLRGIEYPMPVASAQVKSALLLAGLSAEGETTVVEPAPSRDHTERMLAGLGASVLRGNRRVSVQPGLPTGGEIDVPGDLSSAAFFLVAAAARPGAELTLENVGVNPTRDGVIRVLKRMGADLHLENYREQGGEPVADLFVRGRSLQATDIDAVDVSLAVDEIPVLLIAAAVAEGRTRLSGAAELRVKESDRLMAMADGLENLGVAVTRREDGMELEGGRLTGGSVDSHGDHRIAMAFCIAATLGEAPVRVRDVAAVATSYPDFVAQATSLGLNIEVGEQ